MTRTLQSSLGRPRSASRRPFRFHLSARRAGATGRALIGEACVPRQELGDVPLKIKVGAVVERVHSFKRSSDARSGGVMDNGKTDNGNTHWPPQSSFCGRDSLFSGGWRPSLRGTRCLPACLPACLSGAGPAVGRIGAAGAT
jgi:hypothetical protein